MAPTTTCIWKIKKNQRLWVYRTDDDDDASADNFKDAANDTHILDYSDHAPNTKKTHTQPKDRQALVISNNNTKKKKKKQKKKVITSKTKTRIPSTTNSAMTVNIIEDDPYPEKSNNYYDNIGNNNINMTCQLSQEEI